MEVSTRELEEDEIKIDNLLNKILHSCKLIEELNKQIITSKDSTVFDKEYMVERARKIDILLKTVQNLVTLADDIDVTDETITIDLEKELKKKMVSAIDDIKGINRFLESEKTE
ncbi:MAG: hypothetical protein U9O94_00200 [Nanoarchaeota archaeon]|nr:hypothetical protein [Nanoarchaeota archaeon]